MYLYKFRLVCILLFLICRTVSSLEPEESDPTEFTVIASNSSEVVDNTMEELSQDSFSTEPELETGNDSSRVHSAASSSSISKSHKISTYYLYLIAFFLQIIKNIYQRQERSLESPLQVKFTKLLTIFIY